jgi:general secretion pathway protein G
MISPPRQGFTLIEIIIVLAILATLAGVAVSYYGDFTEQATESAVRNNLRVLRGAIENHMKRHLEGPTSFSQLGQLKPAFEMTLYQMPGKNVNLEVEIPDRGEVPANPYEGVSENVMVATHTKWATVVIKNNAEVTEDLPVPPYSVPQQQFRNVRLSGNYKHW